MLHIINSPIVCWTRGNSGSGSLSGSMMSLLSRKHNVRYHHCLDTRKQRLSPHKLDCSSSVSTLASFVGHVLDMSLSRTFVLWHAWTCHFVRTWCRPWLRKSRHLNCNQYRLGIQYPFFYVSHTPLLVSNIANPRNTIPHFRVTTYLFCIRVTFFLPIQLSYLALYFTHVSFLTASLWILGDWL
jgi:hypothetical protein